jgi:hypothetical protein
MIHISHCPLAFIPVVHHHRDERHSMKDFRCAVQTANCHIGTLTGQIREWKNLSEYERKAIAEILAKLTVDACLHPRLSCQISVCGTIVQP